MAYRKVFVNLQVKVCMLIDEGTEVAEVVDELDSNFSDGTGKATIEDSEIKDYEVIDSR